MWQVIFGARGIFSLLLDVHDLLTFDLINILVCIMIDLMNRVRKYKHFKGSFLFLFCDIYIQRYNDLGFPYP